MKIVFEGTQTRSEADGPVRCHPNPRTKRGKHSVIIGHQFNGDGMLTWPSHNGINNPDGAQGLSRWHSFRPFKCFIPSSPTCGDRFPGLLVTDRGQLRNEERRSLLFIWLASIPLYICEVDAFEMSGCKWCCRRRRTVPAKKYDLNFSSRARTCVKKVHIEAASTMCVAY